MIAAPGFERPNGGTQRTARASRAASFITWRAGSDARINFRGGRSADGDFGRNARKLHKRAVKKGFMGVADRYKNDIPWRLSMIANGHTPQSIALIIERSLQPVSAEPLPYQVREQWFGGQYYATTDQLVARAKALAERLSIYLKGKAEEKMAGP